MAYSQLIKNFERIRNYMKQFYIYGFKTRDEYDAKSGRSYDDERRRIESYLGDYMAFRQTREGKAVFISIDSRSARGNPLYNAFRAKSFTDGDITLHFILLDILCDPQARFTAGEIVDAIDGRYLNRFGGTAYDESTVRKKLNEYVSLGLFRAQKQGKRVFYSRCEDVDIAPWAQAVGFFSEAGGLGVIGSFLLDRLGCQSDFAFKHHYITGALDSEILYEIFLSIREKRLLEFAYEPPRAHACAAVKVTPLKVYFSVQTGREYLMACARDGQIRAYRLDYMRAAKRAERAPDYAQAQRVLENVKPHLWGVALGNCARTERVEFTVRIEPGEEYIYRRLLREKRQGQVTRLDETTFRFSADVYDTTEMIPWIRTFTGRLTGLNFSNRTVENQFRRDLEAMYRLYEIEE